MRPIHARLEGLYENAGTQNRKNHFRELAKQIWIWLAWLVANGSGWGKDSQTYRLAWQLQFFRSRGGTFIQYRLSQGDLFYKLFLGDLALGPQCETQCKYKYDRSSADIRIGDLWGKTYQHDQKGTSALIAFTEKGCRIIESLQDVTIVEHPFDVVAEGQMKKNAHRKDLYPVVMWMLKHNFSLDGLAFKMTFFVQRVISKFKSFIWS